MYELILLSNGRQIGNNIILPSLVCAVKIAKIVEQYKYVCDVLPVGEDRICYSTNRGYIGYFGQRRGKRRGIGDYMKNLRRIAKKFEWNNE